MKRPALWIGVSIVAVALLQMGVTFWFLVPHIDHMAYVIRWSGEFGDATGWQALMPYHAWPILVTYLGALVALAIPIGVAVCHYRMQKERQAIAEREAAADAQMKEARHVMAKARGIEQAAQDKLQTAMQEVAIREQEAAAQVATAEFRMNRSVQTNIGLHKQNKNLKERLDGLGEQGTIGHC